MPDDMHAPSDWLTQNLDLLPRGARVLDVASGQGRHALVLAAAGWRVEAVDRDEAELASLRDRAAALGVEVVTTCVDLESGEIDLGESGYGAVLVFNYLHRALMPALIRCLLPGGVLLYETFTKGQAGRGHPRNPAFLLDEGELARLVAPLEIIRSREGDFNGKLVSSVAARKR